MKLLKKISTKTVLGDVSKLVKGGEIDKPTNALRIMGTATGIASGESNFGEWKALVGQFAAINLLTGEESRSGKAFVPDTVTDIVETALNKLKADGEENASVEFAIDVEIVPNPDLAVGYEYNAIPHIQESADPFERLRAQCRQGS